MESNERHDEVVSRAQNVDSEKTRDYGMNEKSFPKKKKIRIIVGDSLLKNIEGWVLTSAVVYLKILL